MGSQKLIYRIGSWTIYPDLLLLRKDRTDFKVQDKVRQVLIVLLEANGEVVSKAAFYQKVWANAVVTENSLNKAISELRKILDQACGKNEYIATVPRKGYRLVKSISKEKIHTKPLETNRNNGILKKFVVIFGILTVILIVVFYSFKSDPKLGIVLSPDGSKVAYFKKAGDRYALFTEDIQLRVVRTVVSDLSPESILVTWSPDGDQLIYNATTKEDPYYSINVVSLKDQHTLFMKFAKKEENHQTESTPADLDSLVLSVRHREIKSGSDKIHHIYLNEEDTIKVYFQENVIESFSW